MVKEVEGLFHMAMTYGNLTEATLLCSCQRQFSVILRGRIACGR